MFNRLPKSLKIKIYEYDMTYHNIYINVLNESMIPKNPRDFKDVLNKFYKPLKIVKENGSDSATIDSTKSLLVSKIEIETKK